MGELTSEAARGTQHSCTATPTPIAATEGARHGGERTWMTASGLSPLRLAPIKLSSSSRCASMVPRALQALEVGQPADEHECTRTRRHALCATRTSLRTTNEHAQNTAHKAPVMLCEVGNGAFGVAKLAGCHQIIILLPQPSRRERLGLKLGQQAQRNRLNAALIQHRHVLERRLDVGGVNLGQRPRVVASSACLHVGQPVIHKLRVLDEEGLHLSVVRPRAQLHRTQQRR